jgi:hypothetical protein
MHLAFSYDSKIIQILKVNPNPSLCRPLSISKMKYKKLKSILKAPLAAGMWQLFEPEVASALVWRVPTARSAAQ